MQSETSQGGDFGTSVLEAVVEERPSISHAVTSTIRRRETTSETDILHDAPERRAVAAPVTHSSPFWRDLRTRLPILAADLTALGICGAIAYGTLMLIDRPAAEAVRWAIPITLLPFIFAYWLGGLYSGFRMQPASELRQVIHANLIVLLAMGIGAILNPPFRNWFALVGITTFAAVPFFRALARKMVSRKSWWGYPTLVIGSGHNASAVAQVLIRNPKAGLKPVAISDPEATCRVSFLPLVNDPAAVDLFIKARSIKHAVISLPEMPNAQVAELVERYSAMLPYVLVFSECSRLPGLWSLSGGRGRINTVEVRNAATLLTPRFAKRILDLSLAVFAFIMGIPAIVGIAIAIKLTSPGPIFFGHTRIGRDGKKFRIWKFRTMHPDGARILKEHLEKDPEARREWERVFKLQDDPRVTKIGNILRKTSLDELPQLWNVLKGEMSLVGPRPIIDAEVPRYADAFRFYTAVKPGVTGLWQICGRNDTSYETRVHLDEYYVRNWTPWLDLYILTRTLLTLMRRTGAY